jgi:hypothetical protein
MADRVTNLSGPFLQSSKLLDSRWTNATLSIFTPLFTSQTSTPSSEAETAYF